MPRLDRAAIALFSVASCHASATQPTVESRSAPPPYVQTRGAHGRAIAAIAVTSDGASAVSVDALGSLRLWPTLDGAREPIVLAGAPARALAIARDGDGVAIAAIDPAQHVSITRWSMFGEPRGRATIDRQAVSIHAVGSAFAIVTTDRIALVITPSGEERTRFVPEPGEGVAGIAVAGDRALAMIEDQTGTFGRWLDTLAATPRLPIEGKGATLAPNGRVIAGRDAKGIAIVDLATGTRADVVTCGSTARAVGFADQTTLVCGEDFGLHWFSIVETKEVPTSSLSHAVMAGGRLVGTQGKELVVATRGEVRYLGYRVETFPHVKFEHGGILVGLGDQHASWLDDNLRVLPHFELPKVGWMWLDLSTLDERTVVALVEQSANRMIAMVDRETGMIGATLDVPDATVQVELDATQGALLVNTQHGRAVHRIDPKTRAFGEPLPIDAPLAWFLDPAISGGASILAFDPTAHRVRELALDGTLLAASAVTGEFRAFDRSGRIYTTSSEVPFDVTGYRRGAAELVLPGAGEHQTIPAPDGRSVAVVEPLVISLYDEHGMLRWATPVWHPTQVAWSNNQLVAQLPGAFVRLDRATGTYARRQCGWDFGSWPAPNTKLLGDDELVCDVAR